MKDVPNEQLQELIDGLQTGDEATREVARKKLIDRAAERLRRLAHKILRKSFPPVGKRHETGSVLSESALRLMMALRQIQPPKVEDFFRLAAMHMRYVLLDMVRNDAREAEALNPELELKLAASGEGPETLAGWTEFHKKVEELPEDERQVVNLCWYLGMKQIQAAKILGIHPREVSRRWGSAIAKLPDPDA
jgi:RNA polymerase sigma factor (sigma-70 family)